MTRRVKTHMRLGIRSVSPSDQSPRCLHEETLGPYLPIAKFRGVSPRNLVVCLREISRSVSANFRGVSPRNFAKNTLGEISDFYFSPRKKYISRKGCTAAKREKELFSLADLYISSTQLVIFPTKPPEVTCIIKMHLEEAAMPDY